MKTSPAGVALVKGYEGLGDGNKNTNILEPYQDQAGLWTLGYGARYDKYARVVTKNTPAITEKEASDLLTRDLINAENAVNLYVTAALTQNQFDALVDFTYNCGAGALQKSGLCAKINAGSTISVVDFTAYSKATVNGKLVTLPVLVKRRKEEAALFIKG